MNCARCGEVIAPANVKPEHRLAQCGRCGLVFDISEPSTQTPASPARPVVLRREPVPVPRHVDVGPYRQPDASMGRDLAKSRARAELRWQWRSWRRAEDVLSLGLFGLALVMATVYGCVSLASGRHPYIVAAVLLAAIVGPFGVGMLYACLAILVNHTEIRLADGVLRVRHGPLPTGAGRTALAQEIEQIWVTAVPLKDRTRYALEAQLTNGKSIRLVSGLDTPEQGLWLEQVLEDALGIVNVRMPGEIETPRTRQQLPDDVARLTRGE